MKPSTEKKEAHPELWAITVGVIASLGWVARSLLPPLFAPVQESWIFTADYLAVLPCCATPFLFIHALLRRRPWIPMALIYLCLYLTLRASSALEDSLWDRHFVRSAAERERFVQFVKSQQLSSAEELRKVNLSKDFPGLSDQKLGYLFRDEHGRFYASYSLCTSGIDNSVGLTWSESGHPPPRLAFPEIVHSRPLGGGWYMFRST